MNTRYKKTHKILCHLRHELALKREILTCKSVSTYAKYIFDVILNAFSSVCVYVCVCERERERESCYEFINPFIVRFLFTVICMKVLLGIMIRVFTNGQRDWGSIPGQVMPKTQKMVLDTS